jgi:hypothetical protein
LPKDVLLDEGESAAPWPVDNKPFSAIVRKATGKDATYQTLLEAQHLLSEATLYMEDYPLARQRIIRATTLLMTMEYDMLKEILIFLQNEYDLETGEYTECEYPSLAVE